MKLFKLDADVETFATILTVSQDGKRLWPDTWFNGTPHETIRRTSLARKDEQDESKPLADFTLIDLRPIPTLSKRAIDALSPQLTKCGDFIQIEVVNQDFSYFAMNPTTVFACLDTSRSEMAHFRDGRIMAVEHHVLLDGISALPLIFKIPETRRNTTYVNETFTEIVASAGLTGFEFSLLFER